MRQASLKMMAEAEFRSADGKSPSAKRSAKQPSMPAGRIVDRAVNGAEGQFYRSIAW